MGSVMTKRNLLFLSHLSIWGGAQKCLYTLLESLDREKYEPVVILSGSGDLKTKIDKLKIKTIVLEIPWVISPDRFPNQIQDRINKIAQIIHSERIDLVFTNTSVILDGAIAAKICQIPHVWHVLELWSYDPNLKPKAIGGLPTFFSIMDLFSDKMIGVSNAVKDDILQYIETDKVDVIYTGIKVPNVTREQQEVRQSLGLDHRSPVVFFAGELSQRKGILTLIRSIPTVIEKFPKTKFVICGSDGGQAERAEQLITEYGIQEQVHLLGFRTDVIDILNISDLFVLPSEADPLPVVVLEAMALGKPVVATCSGGASEMVSDSVTGFLVPVNDPKSMSDAILNVLSRSDFGSSLGEEAYHRFLSMFSVSTYVSSFESLFEQLIDNPETEYPVSCLKAEHYQAIYNLLGLGSRAQFFEKDLRHYQNKLNRMMSQPLVKLMLKIKAHLGRN